MKALKTLFIATALLGSAAGVQAADNFVGLTWGETSNNIQKSKSLNRNLNSPNLDKVIDNTLNDRAAPARACFDGRAGRSGRISSGGTS